MIQTFRVGSLHTFPDATNITRSELDSHADTCVIGDSTALVIMNHDTPVRVYGYDEDKGTDAPWLHVR